MDVRLFHSKRHHDSSDLWAVSVSLLMQNLILYISWSWPSTNASLPIPITGETTWQPTPTTINNINFTMSLGSSPCLDSQTATCKHSKQSRRINDGWSIVTMMKISGRKPLQQNTYVLPLRMQTPWHGLPNAYHIPVLGEQGKKVFLLRSLKISFLACNFK